MAENKNGSGLLDPAKTQEVEKPKYTEEEEAYNAEFLRKIETAIINREGPHEGFDGGTYTAYLDSNEKLANALIEPKKNKQDSNFQSGTARDKMLALLAALNNLNLEPDISAFDENNVEIANMGESMEDTIMKSQEMDGDEEKKFLRQYEMLKHGFVFCEEIWDERWMNDKKITQGGKFTGQVTGLKWTTKLKRMFSGPSVNVLPPSAVYLGDISQYFITLQPHIFTVEVTSYHDAKSRFGKWERWKYVPKSFDPQTFETSDSLFKKAWEIVNAGEGEVVIVRYQDKWANEAAVWISGVMMTPIGLPLTAINGFAEYSITQQNLEPINSKFAYGNSLMRKLRGKVGALDEMIRMAVLKDQKSYAPPKLNFSGRVLSSKIFGPAVITHGVPRDSIVDLDPNNSRGIESSEIAMIQEMKEQINSSSTSPQFQGQPGKGDQTATEIVELQRQAKMVLGLTIFACSLLEWKLSWLRLYNLLAKWFEPVEQKLNDARTKLVDQYRVTSQRKPIPGKGVGNRIVVPMRPSEEMPMPTVQQVKEAEDDLEKKSGKPTRIVVANIDEIKSSKNVWQITIKPTEKPTSEQSKLLFRAELSDAMVFGQMVNMDFYAEMFARTWNRDPSKAFNRNVPVQPAVPVTAKGVSAPVPGENKVLGAAAQALGK